MAGAHILGVEGVLPADPMGTPRAAGSTAAAAQPLSDPSSTPKTAVVLLYILSLLAPAVCFNYYYIGVETTLKHTESSYVFGLLFLPMKILHAILALGPGLLAMLRVYSGGEKSPLARGR